MNRLQRVSPHLVRMWSLNGKPSGYTFSQFIEQNIDYSKIDSTLCRKRGYR